MAGYTELATLAIALELCPLNGLVQVPWVQLKDMDDPTLEARITRQIPEGWGTTHPGIEYWHGTKCLWNLPYIRYYGLHGSKGTASPDFPSLYTCKNRRTPLNSYCEESYLVFEDLDSGIPCEKKFKALIGIGSTSEWPHHWHKVPRSPAHKNQFLHKEGQFQVMWIEFVALTDCVIDRTGLDKTARDRSRYNARHASAEQMIITVGNEELWEFHERPPKRVRLAGSFAMRQRWRW